MQRTPNNEGRDLGWWASLENDDNEEGSRCFYRPEMRQELHDLFDTPSIISKLLFGWPMPVSQVADD